MGSIFPGPLCLLSVARDKVDRQSQLSLETSMGGLGRRGGDLLSVPLLPSPRNPTPAACMLTVLCLDLSSGTHKAAVETYGSILPLQPPLTPESPTADQGMGRLGESGRWGGYMREGDAGSSQDPGDVYPELLQPSLHHSQ